jgi:peptide/nickel transport system ATP-binding protein
MRDGRAVEHDTVGQVLGAPAAPYTKALIAAVPRIDTPRTERRPEPRAETADAEPLLQLEDLHKHFPAHGGFALRREEP